MTTLRNVRDRRSEDGSSAAAGRSLARELLQRRGGAPLMYFSLLPDKRYLFGGEDGADWGIAYRVIRHHALALGDPLSSPDAATEAVGAFLRLCLQRRWTPAFYQVTAAHLDLYRDSGMRVIKIGEDAQIRLSEFFLAGKRFKNLRNDLRRIEKAGVILEEYGPEKPPSVAAVSEMAEISARWRRAHRAQEGTFAMGGFDPESALFRESRFFTARTAEDGRMLAFATFIPVFGPPEARGWALDLMRRRADALHGVMDFLIVSAAQQFGREGAALLSLGLSPLAGEEDPAEAAQIARVRRFLYTHMNRVYNFQGLHTFKAKFATHWEPRYLVCRRGVGLAATAGAVLKAHLTLPGEERHRPFYQRRFPRQPIIALGVMTLLMVTPFEKTLAKRAIVLPHEVARTWSAQSAHWKLPRWNRIPLRLGHLHRIASDTDTDLFV